MSSAVRQGHLAWVEPQRCRADSSAGGQLQMTPRGSPFTGVICRPSGFGWLGSGWGTAANRQEDEISSHVSNNSNSNTFSSVSGSFSQRGLGASSIILPRSHSFQGRDGLFPSLLTVPQMQGLLNDVSWVERDERLHQESEGVFILKIYTVGFSTVNKYYLNNSLNPTFLLFIVGFGCLLLFLRQGLPM